MMADTIKANEAHELVAYHRAALERLDREHIDSASRMPPEAAVAAFERHDQATRAMRASLHMLRLTVYRLGYGFEPDGGHA